MWTFTSIFNTANRWLWQQEGKRKVEEGHWYTHIMRKVNVKEWERTHALWCKGYGRVKLGPTQPPPPYSLFDAAASGTWDFEGARHRAAWGQLCCHEASGIGELAFVLKENVRGFGWGRWKGHKQGSWGDQNKQTGGSTSERFLRLSRVRWCMNFISPSDVYGW